MHPLRIRETLAAAILIAALNGEARGQWVVVAAPGWAWPVTGIAGTWPGLYGPWGCLSASCLEDARVRRAIQREVARLQWLAERDEHAQAALLSGSRSPHPDRSHMLPVTPEAHVQPAYRGTGEIRPEFRDSGLPLREFPGSAR